MLQDSLTTSTLAPSVWVRAVADGSLSFAFLPKRVSRLLGQAKTGLEKATWAANSCYFYLFQAQAYAVGRWAASATTHMPVPMVK